MKKSLIIPLSSLFAIALLLFLKWPVYANDGVLGVTPDGVYPITQSDIMMVSEEINIDCTTGKVTCRFDFKNYGSDQTVLMGFPARLNENLEYSSFTEEEDVTIRNFTAREGEKKLPVTLAETIPNPPLKEVNGMEEYSKWYTFSVNFKKNEEKTLYHTYEVNFPFTSDGNVYMGYVIETGALWKGPIGHSKVIFDMGDIPMYTLDNLFPNNYYRIEGQKLIFESREFKPEYNLSVLKNEHRFSEEWLNDMYLDSELKAFIKQRLEIFKITPKAIRENSQTYFARYQELVNEDPISALYIKSALGLYNGNEKPANASCEILKHSGSVWEYEVSATDPDGDIIGFEAEYQGLEPYNLENYSSEMSYRSETKKFVGRGYLNINADFDQSTPFSITFTIKDSAGNSDTATILLQTELLEPSQTPTSTPFEAPLETSLTTPQSTPIADEPGNAISAYQSVNEGERLIPMEAETIPLLITGVILVLVVSLIVITILFIKKKSRGYLLFIAQLIFFGLSFYQLIEIFNIRNETDGVMSSEIVSGKIGLSAVLWAIGMLCMLVGIILTGKGRKTKT